MKMRYPVGFVKSSDYLFSSGHKKDVPLTVLMFMLIFCLH